MHTAAAVARKTHCLPKADMRPGQAQHAPNLDTLLHVNPLQLRPWRCAFLFKRLNGLMLTHHLQRAFTWCPALNEERLGGGKCFPTRKLPRTSLKIMRWAPKGNAAQQTAARLQGNMAPPPARSRQPASRHQVEARKQEWAGLCAEHLHTTQCQWRLGKRAPLTPISTKSNPVRREKAESRGSGQSGSTARRSVACYKLCNACVLELQGNSRAGGT